MSSQDIRSYNLQAFVRRELEQASVRWSCLLTLKFREYKVYWTNREWVSFLRDRPAELVPINWVPVSSQF